MPVPPVVPVPTEPEGADPESASPAGLSSSSSADGEFGIAASGPASSEQTTISGAPSASSETAGAGVTTEQRLPEPTFAVTRPVPVAVGEMSTTTEAGPAGSAFADAGELAEPEPPHDTFADSDVDSESSARLVADLRRSETPNSTEPEGLTQPEQTISGMDVAPQPSDEIAWTDDVPTKLFSDKVGAVAPDPLEIMQTAAPGRTSDAAAAEAATIADHAETPTTRVAMVADPETASDDTAAVVSELGEPQSSAHTPRNVMAPISPSEGGFPTGVLAPGTASQASSGLHSAVDQTLPTPPPPPPSQAPAASSLPPAIETPVATIALFAAGRTVVLPDADGDRGEPRQAQGGGTRSKPSPTPHAEQPPKTSRSGTERVGTVAVSEERTSANAARCRSIVMKAQLGEETSYADRTYLRSACGSRR